MTAHRVPTHDLTIPEMLEFIRDAVRRCKDPERDMLLALTMEADEWDRRLAEIEDADDPD